MVEKTLRDFKEILKKFHNNFGDFFFFGQGEIEKQISQHQPKVPRNPSSNTLVRQANLAPTFSKSQEIFPYFQKVYPIHFS